MPAARCSARCLSPRSKDAHRGRVQIDPSARPGSLASRLMHLVVDGDEPAVDRDGGRLLVEVLPPEPQELVAAHPGEGCRPQGREEAVAGGGAQEGPQLLRRPGTLFDPRDGPKAGGVGDQGDVPRDEPATHGLLESPPDDQVDLVHRLRSERGVSVARMEQPVVEGVEVVGRRRRRRTRPSAGTMWFLTL
jgi:hypothetical protein